MNKPSSAPNRIGVREHVSDAPVGTLGRIRNTGGAIALLVAAACSYNPAARTVLPDSGSADAGGQDASADAQRPDAPQPDAGEDGVSPDVGPDVPEADVGVDAGADVGVDAGADAGADARDDVSPPPPPPDAGEDAEGGDGGVSPPPPPDFDDDGVLDDDDSCDFDAVDPGAARGTPDADDDGDGCPNGLDRCEGGPDDITPAGIGSPDNIDNDRLPDTCDRYPACSDIAAQEAGLSESSFCEIDQDGDGIPDNIGDPCPADPEDRCVPPPPPPPEGADAGPDASLQGLRNYLKRIFPWLRKDTLPPPSALA